MLKADIFSKFFQLNARSKQTKQEIIKESTAKNWTIVAAIVIRNEIENEEKIICIGSGNKCLNPVELNSNILQYTLLHDSHAEILARRTFIRYLMCQLKECKKNSNSSSIFELSTQEMEESFILRKGISFQFFVSHLPCIDTIWNWYMNICYN